MAAVIFRPRIVHTCLRAVLNRTGNARLVPPTAGCEGGWTGECLGSPAGGGIRSSPCASQSAYVLTFIRAYVVWLRESPAATGGARGLFDSTEAYGVQ
jgi:hypothetical protein